MTEAGDGEIEETARVRPGAQQSEWETDLTARAIQHLLGLIKSKHNTVRERNVTPRGVSRLLAHSYCSYTFSIPAKKVDISTGRVSPIISGFPGRTAR